MRSTITIQGYQVNAEPFASGSSGFVHYANKNGTNERYVVKYIRLHPEYDKKSIPDQEKDVKKEVDILKKMGVEAKLYDGPDEGTLTTKLILMPDLGVDLEKHFQRQHEKMSFLGFLRLYLDALRPLVSLHKLGYVHLDLKPGNFSIHDDKIYLLDFGSVLPINLVHTHCAGTVDFMSPEMAKLELEQITFINSDIRTDSFSFNMAFLRILMTYVLNESDSDEWNNRPKKIIAKYERAGSPTYQGSRVNYSRILNDAKIALKKDNAEQYHSQIDQCCDLILESLNEDLNQRPTSSEAFSRIAKVRFSIEIKECDNNPGKLLKLIKDNLNSNESDKVIAFLDAYLDFYNEEDNVPPKRPFPKEYYMLVLWSKIRREKDEEVNRWLNESPKNLFERVAIESVLNALAEIEPKTYKQKIKDEPLIEKPVQGNSDCAYYESFHKVICDLLGSRDSKNIVQSLDEHLKFYDQTNLIFKNNKYSKEHYQVVFWRQIRKKTSSDIFTWINKQLESETPEHLEAKRQAIAQVLYDFKAGDPDGYLKFICDQKIFGSNKNIEKLLGKNMDVDEQGKINWFWSELKKQYGQIDELLPWIHENLTGKNKLSAKVFAQELYELKKINPEFSTILEMQYKLYRAKLHWEKEKTKTKDTSELSILDSKISAVQGLLKHYKGNELSSFRGDVNDRGTKAALGRRRGHSCFSFWTPYGEELVRDITKSVLHVERKVSAGR